MFGTRLRELRTEKKYTQDELGALLGVSGKTVGSWERETREPSMEKINQIADILNTSTDYLFGKTNSKRKVGNDNDEIDIDENSIMTFEGKPIPPEDLKVIKRILRSAREDDK